MKNIGPYAEQLFFLILENQKNFWIAYGAHKYQTIKNICKNGAYNLPFEMESLCK